MDERFGNIKQAEYPIQMFDWQASDGSSILLKGEQVSAAYARSCVVDALKTFIVSAGEKTSCFNCEDDSLFFVGAILYNLCKCCIICACTVGHTGIYACGDCVRLMFFGAMQ